MFLVVLVFASLGLLLPLGRVGIWDPPELEVAEFARRIAVGLLGAEELSLPDTVNEVPIRRELGRGELPFTSVALGFKLLGLADWSGRLPLALWGLLGVLGCYWLVLRLADAKTGAVAAGLLSVTPLYFVQARTMLGDGVTLAAGALATAGLGLALLDPVLKVKARWAWLALGALGLYAGFWCRGLLLGVAVPLAAVTMARWGCRSPNRRVLDNVLDVGLLLGLGATAAAGVWVLREAQQGAQYSVWLGAASTYTTTVPPHDSVVHHLGHALFPLSVLLPFAVGFLLRPTSPVSKHQLAESRLRLLSIGSIGAGTIAHSLLMPLTGSLPFCATFACAIAVALLLRDLPGLGRQARVVAMGVVAVAAVLLLDFRKRPETSFAAFTTFQASFPDTLVAWHGGVWTLGTLLVTALLLCCYLEPVGSAAPAHWSVRYSSYLASLRSAFAGNLWFALWVGLASLSGWALLVWLSERILALGWFSRMWSLSRVLALHAWWVCALAVFGLPLLLFWALAVVRWLGTRDAGSRPHQRLLSWCCSAPGVTALSWLCFGTVLSLGYFPALAAQLSPKHVFLSYEAQANRGEPLGVLGVSPVAARYSAGVDPIWLDTVPAASRWLLAGPERRFLVTRANDLPELNAHFRRRTRHNLPVIDAASSEMLLVSSELGRSPNQNPFRHWILSEPPAIRNKLDHNLGGRLDVLGWQLKNSEGVVVDAMTPGQSFELSLFYEVVARLDAEWETFVHIDGQGRRLNGDHPTLRGEYPLPLLQPADIIVDQHTLSVDPGFTPGEYRLYFGLFRGSQRLPVTRGAHRDNRIDGGVLQVR